MKTGRRRFHLSRHHHSGRLQSHAETSWWAAALLLVIALAVLAITTTQVFAAQIIKSGDINVAGTVPGPPPSRGAIILRPRNGERFLSNPIIVSGICPAGVIVAIYKNNTFAGSTPCRVDDTFSLEIDLFRGQNVLIAKVFDDLDQAGPDSPPVTVYLDTPVTVVDGTAIPQLILVIDPVYRGTFPDTERQVRPEVYGGRSPYALSFDWGDTKSELVSRPEAGKFGIDHSWERPGEYLVKISASDTLFAQAFVQTTVIINGPTQPPHIGRLIGLDLWTLLIAVWPLLAVTSLMVGAFWLGEHHELDKLPARWRLKLQSNR